ncbi:MAG: type II toxin-antitoxin system RatA family toxin [Pseudomonadota bacterium]|nr:type II toxin-antitoxin system RatA family toxin [Pseudomonadota bacterium]
MNLVRRSEVVPYSARQMYDLVNDVPAYPLFLPWCRSAVVHEAERDEMVATLELAVGGFHKRFTTRNQLTPGRQIELHLVRGPFRHFSGVWRFDDLPPAADRETASSVSLAIDFDLESRLLQMVAGAALQRVADGLVAAFRQRAGTCYDQAG